MIILLIIAKLRAIIAKEQIVKVVFPAHKLQESLADFAFIPALAEVLRYYIAVLRHGLLAFYRAVRRHGEIWDRIVFTVKSLLPSNTPVTHQVHNHWRMQHREIILAALYADKQDGKL